MAALKTHNIILDIGNLNPINTGIRIKRRDYLGHAFSITIKDSGSTFTPPVDCTYRIRFLQKEGYVSESDNLTTLTGYELRLDDVYMAGRTTAEVSIYVTETDGDNQIERRITTCSFWFVIVGDIDFDTILQALNPFPLLEGLKNNLKNLNETASQSASDAEGFAEDAEQSAINAQSSANTASGKVTEVESLITEFSTTHYTKTQSDDKYVVKDGTKMLSDNNFTTAFKKHYRGAYRAV